jgi:hypothetical protein
MNFIVKYNNQAKKENYFKRINILKNIIPFMKPEKTNALLEWDL